jgi:hypothetical protein
MALRLYNKLFTTLLDEKDILSLYTARRIAEQFQYQLTSCGWSIDKASKYVFIAINMAGILYQYSFASWTLYYTTTPSGVKKLYKVIFTNPILTLFFYLSFYFRLITETDRELFNTVANAIGFTSHQDFEYRKYTIDKFAYSMKALCDNISDVIIEHIPEKLSALVYKFVGEKLTNNGVADLVEKGIPFLIERTVTKHSELINRNVSEPAVCVKLSLEEKTDLQQDLENILENKDVLLQRMKTKNKRMRTLQYQQMVERKTPDGRIKCLNECKKRTRTASGCYCEGDCSSTFFNMGKQWCYVDPRKCRGKKFDTFLGKPYDYCNSKDSHKVCHTGYKYKHCVNE